jgi:hypothetical protein
MDLFEEREVTAQSREAVLSLFLGHQLVVDSPHHKGVHRRGEEAGDVVVSRDHVTLPFGAFAQKGTQGLHKLVSVIVEGH